MAKKKPKVYKIKRVKVKKAKVRKLKIKLDDSLDKLAWEMARLMTKQVHSSEFTNQKTFCPQCKMLYCEGVGGLIVWCKECFYQSGCVKELESRRRCLPCSILK